MLLGKLKLVGNGADTTLDKGDLASGVNALPLISEAAGTPSIVDGGINQRGADTAREGSGGVVLEGDDINVLALGSSDGDLPCGLEEMSERLNPGVEVLAKALLNSLKNEIDRGLVAGKTEGSVAAIVIGNLVQVPENILDAVATIVSAMVKTSN